MSSTKQYKLDLHAAAEWRGVSRRTLRRMIDTGELPAVRIGPRIIRVSAEDLDALAVPIPAVKRAA